MFTLEGSFHGFEDGDYIKFSEIRGMTELNAIDPVQIKVISKFLIFKINLF